MGKSVGRKIGLAGIVIFVISAAISLFTYNKSGASKNEEAFQ